MAMGLNDIVTERSLPGVRGDEPRTLNAGRECKPEKMSYKFTTDYGIKLVELYWSMHASNSNSCCSVTKIVNDLNMALLNVS